MTAKRNTLPNNADCKRLAATGTRAEIIDALNYVREYRARRQHELSFLEIQWLDRSAKILDDATR